MPGYSTKHFTCEVDVVVPNDYKNSTGDTPRSTTQNPTHAIWVTCTRVCHSSVNLLDGLGRRLRDGLRSRQAGRQAAGGGGGEGRAWQEASETEKRVRRALPTAAT